MYWYSFAGTGIKANFIKACCWYWHVWQVSNHVLLVFAWKLTNRWKQTISHFTLTRSTLACSLIGCLEPLYKHKMGGGVHGRWWKSQRKPSQWFLPYTHAHIFICTHLSLLPQEWVIHKPEQYIPHKMRPPSPKAKITCLEPTWKLTAHI